LKTLGEWVLGELLGEGAFGQVWKAHARSDPAKLAAVKVPRDDRGAALLRAEGAAQSRLASPRFPRVLGVSTEPPYIAFEYVEGESLRSALLARKLEGHEVHSVARGVLEALAEAHAAGIVHRDVKPENVLLERSGRVLVTDFGLSIPAQVEHSLADEEAPLAGSLPYLAPEIREGKAATERSDLYAWGIVLFEALTGSLPGAAEVPSSLGASSEWDEVYKKAVARPEKRFASARAALDALPKAPPAPRAKTAEAAKPKVDVMALLNRVGKEEAELLKKEFMAYVTPAGRASARVGGKTYTFEVKGPPGLAILRATGPRRAEIVRRFPSGR
jgi:serine/threonine-protein kinase